MPIPLGPIGHHVDCNVSGDGRLVMTISDDGVACRTVLNLAANQGNRLSRDPKLGRRDRGRFADLSGQLGLSFRLSLPASAMAGVKLA
jgi:hypothetical protein